MRQALKTIYSTGLILALLGFSMMGCLEDTSQPLPDSTVATLSVEINAGDHKTIWPAAWSDNIGTFFVEILTVDGASVALQGPLGSDTETVNFTDLEFGTYDVVVSGYCKTGAGLCNPADESTPEESIIAFGRVDDFVFNATNSSVDVTVTPLFGDAFTETGWTEITLEWPTDQGVATVEAERKLVDDATWGDPEVFPRDGVISSEGTTDSVFLSSALDVSGSHLFRFNLYNADGYLIATALEVVNVYGNYMTIGVIELTADDFINFNQPNWEDYVDTMAAGDLEFVVTNWRPVGEPTDLSFPGDYWVDDTWDWNVTDDGPLTAATMNWTPPYSNLLIPNTITETDTDPDAGFEFKLCTAFDPWSCWKWAGSEIAVPWTLVGVPGTYTPTVLGDNEQLHVDANDGDAVLIVFDVIANTITVYANSTAVTTGNLDVNIGLEDPAPGDEFAINCVLDAPDLECAPEPAFDVGVDYKWYLEGILLNEESAATLTYPVALLDPGYRIILVVTDPSNSFAQSAQVTLTPDMLGFGLSEAFIEFSFVTDDMIAVVGDSKLTREPQYDLDGGTYTNNSVEESAITNGWVGGKDTKYWVISFSTVGYENITLSSDQYGSGTGPRDFKVQYQVGTGDWIDIAGGDEIILSESSSPEGTLDNLPLPPNCDNVDGVSVRWVMRENFSIREGTSYPGDEVGGSGNSKIRGITVTGLTLP